MFMTVEFVDLLVVHLLLHVFHNLFTCSAPRGSQARGRPRSGTRGRFIVVARRNLWRATIRQQAVANCILKELSKETKRGKSSCFCNFTSSDGKRFGKKLNKPLNF